MKIRYLFLLMAMLLTFSATAQIDPPQPPAYGWLRLCEFGGQVALRELPEGGSTTLTMLQADDLVEPFNELQYDTNGVEWRRVRASIWDGWLRTKKPNGSEITVCMSSDNVD